MKLFPQSELKERRRQLARDNRRFGRTLECIPKVEWPAELNRASSKPVLEVWRSRDFLLVIWEERPLLHRLSVCRTALDRHGEFLADISWDDLQWLKNAAGYAGHDAIEIYPAAVDLVNVANMRHLWIDLASTGCEFTWRNKKA